MNITPQSIRSFFYAAYYEQGKTYKSHVISIKKMSTDNGFVLNGKVRGRRTKPYLNTIKIMISPNFKFMGTCECSVGYNCKHVAATLFAAIERGLFNPQNAAKERRNKINAWVEALSALTKSDVFQAERPKKQLFYELSPSGVNGILSLTLKTRAYLKKGGFGVEREYDLYKYSYNYSTPEYISKSDEHIFYLIKRLEHTNYHNSSIELQGISGNIIIQRIVATQRCFYYKDRYTPLCMGKPLQFDLKWRKIGRNMKPSFVSGALTTSILLTEPYMYIDPNTGSIGLAEGISLDTDTIKLLFHAPDIKSNDADYLSWMLLKHLPNTNIPIPNLKLDRTVDKTPASFYLTMTAELIDKRIQRSALFKIAYGNHYVSPNNRIEVDVLKGEDDTFTHIGRDMQAEAKAIEKLKSYGFSPVINNDMYQMQFCFAAGNNSQYELAKWHTFLKTAVDGLRKDGWIVKIARSFNMVFGSVKGIEATVKENDNWFDLSFDLIINGKHYNSIPIIADILSSFNTIEEIPSTIYLNIGNEHFAVLPKASILPIIKTLFELFDTRQNNESFKLHPYDAPLLDKLKNGAIHFKGSKKLQAMADALHSFNGIKKIAVPHHLNAELRPYQHEGYSWLQFLRKYGFGGILADDMGLGKTVQILAHLLKEKEEGRLHIPALIVVPTSLISNWQNEKERFTPDLLMLVLHGSKRQELLDKINQYDLILTTYPLIVRDFDKLKQFKFYYIILDEAQSIKNYRSKSARLVGALKSEYRLCLTGTPMENNLGELWGLFDFVMPGFLFSNKLFKNIFQNPIEKEQNEDKQMLLNDRIYPFLMRRTKDKVAKELPPKVEITRFVSLEKKQAKLYETIRIAMDKRVRDAIKEKGLARSHIMVLDALLKLRQVCCDPHLVKLDYAKTVDESAKFDMLFELLYELLKNGRKILLFSQFTSMLALIEARLKKEKIDYTKLIGKTRKRDEVIERFRSGEVSLFLISLKTGGVGLNLAEADAVIHYDPWWNPAVELQASDRAHRIGQKKTVFVYKLITKNTVEEKILKLQRKKQALADSLYNNKKQAMEITQEDLQSLFEPIHAL